MSKVAYLSDAILAAYPDTTQDGTILEQYPDALVSHVDGELTLEEIRRLYMVRDGLLVRKPFVILVLSKWCIAADGIDTAELLVETHYFDPPTDKVRLLINDLPVEVSIQDGTGKLLLTSPVKDRYEIRVDMGDDVAYVAAALTAK